MAGRISIYELWPLMISEVWQNKQEDVVWPLVDRLLGGGVISPVLEQVPGILFDAERVRLVEAEEYILQWGGMPALPPMSDEVRWQWLQDYQYTYLERDVADLARLADLVPFRTFQRLSALRSGQLINYSELARKLEKKWLGGLVVYRGDEIKRLAEFDIWAVPSYRLFC